MTMSVQVDMLVAFRTMDMAMGMKEVADYLSMLGVHLRGVQYPVQ